MLVLVLVPNQGQAQALGAGAQPGKALAVIWPALGAGTGVHQARPWQWWPVIELGAGADAGAQPGKALAMVTDSTRQALAVVAGDRAGRRCRCWCWCPTRGKPRPWALVFNQASPWLWPGLRLELALVFTRKSPGPGCRC